VSVEQGIERSVTEFRADGDESAFKIEASLIFDQGFPAFSGHFPGNPILPGIIQLASVRMLATRFLRQPLVPSCLSNIKFREMIRPGQPVNISMSGHENGSGWNIRFEINGSDVAIASGDMLLVPSEPPQEA